MTSTFGKNMRRFIVTFSAVLLAAGAMVAILCAGQHSPLFSPNGGRWVLGASIALVVYGIAACFVGRIARKEEIAKRAFWGGTVGAVVQVVHMSLEAFGSHAGDRPGITAIFMCISFGVWFSMGVWTSVATRKVGAATTAALLSAMFTMSIAVGFGLLLTLLGFPDDGYVRGWTEFTQSGWNDPRAFAVANSLDAIVSHFLMGPLIGALLGALGALLVVAFRRMKGANLE
jgi:hypothetical protein